ncbi:transmembrane protein 184 homolog DDB_G0279555-like [Dioscorea cayenensis subsp. rotundata]|uniref:Transmembrane protein 184 homolog DDB_G0279555-like n=1 Tax=Dioscorea cayennensis subsp. rotundata TaxID=55577 RepID=A0AB40CLR6_DIOCR|nr:transmembrane protein 184 homolog DDB_G0279555-like [Dioscorea cayenensis subsp. rotundata]
MEIINMNPRTFTLLVTGSCVMLSVHFTIRLLSQHLFHWKNPKEQKAILVIILMAPLYAIVSFVGLLDIQGSEAFFTFLESVKECYEALVIAKFLALMYSYLNISISKNIVPDEIKGREIHHSFPMTLFQPHSVRLNHHTLKLLKYWTWQFVIIRPVCSVLMIVLELLGWYTSWISWTFTIILNISVSLALYALVIFYHVFAKELEPHKPLAKFLCIKGIVFFCFWQGLALEGLTAAGVIRSHHFWLDVEHIQEALQNVMVILEMVVFSIVQRYAYSAIPYTGASVDKPKHE